jgi:polyisoprenoid-binding protein YceI
MYVMKTILSALVMVFISTTTLIAQALKTSKFNVAFSIKNAGLTVNGSFKTGAATISYNPAKQEQSKFSGFVTVKSINTGIAKRDEHLQQADYFDAAKFADIKMESTKVVVTTAGANVTFNVTMHGVTKSLTVPVAVVKNADGSFSFSTKFTVNRRDWGVGSKSVITGDNVTLNITATAK